MSAPVVKSSSSNEIVTGDTVAIVSVTVMVFVALAEISPSPSISL